MTQLSDQLFNATATHHKTLKRLYAPMASYFGVTEASIFYVNKACEMVNIHTHPDWMAHCMEKSYYKDDPHIISPENNDTGFALWSSYSTDAYQTGILHDSIELYDISHGISYVEKDKHGYRAYTFGTSKDNFQMQNKMLNNLDCVKQFINHLKLELQPIVASLAEQAINVEALKGTLCKQQPGITFQANKMNPERLTFLTC